MANTATLTSGVQGYLGQALGAGNVTATQYNPPPYLTQPIYVPSPPTPTEKEVTVPIIDKSDKVGVFLRDKNGALVHISAERLYLAAGLEW